MKWLAMLLLSGVALGQQIALPNRCSIDPSTLSKFPDEELASSLATLIDCSQISRLKKADRLGISVLIEAVASEQGRRPLIAVVSEQMIASETREKHIEALEAENKSLKEERRQLIQSVMYQQGMISALAVQPPADNSAELTQLHRLNDTLANIQRTQRQQLLDNETTFHPIGPVQIPPKQIFCDATKLGTGPYATTQINCY